VPAADRVLIVGDQGQDGKLLGESLANSGYDIVGLGQDALRVNGQKISSGVSILNFGSVCDVIQKYRPKEIYYLAAFHQSAELRDSIAIERTSYINSLDVHVLGLLNILFGVLQNAPTAKIFYAASSLVFGDDDTDVKTELSAFNPTCIYGMTKAHGLWICRQFRNNHNLFVSGGILYNHDSAYRKEQFLTAKIIKHAIKVSNGETSDALEIGDLGIQLDLGYAPDYINAFRKILNFHTPDDFIVATGTMSSVEDFVKQVYGYFNLDWKDYIKVNPQLLPKKPVPRIGSPEKLNGYAGISVSRPFDEIVFLLIKDHLKVRS
jgi:GDPmannose 4,6-dehydratase